MGVRVDKAGCHDFPRAVQFHVAPGALQQADRGDTIASHADVGARARGAGAVDDVGVSDQQVEVFIHVFELKRIETQRTQRSAEYAKKAMKR